MESCHIFSASNKHLIYVHLFLLFDTQNNQISASTEMVESSEPKSHILFDYINRKSSLIQDSLFDSVL